jgi:hypothetical protein
MCPLPVYWRHWKEVFEEVIFSSNIIKTPQETEERKKRERKKEKEKGMLHESVQIKGKLIFWEQKKHFDFKNPFWCDSIPPFIIPLQKTFPKSSRKFS